MNTDHAATEPTPLDVDREGHTNRNPSTDQILTSAAAVVDTTLPHKVALLVLVIAVALVYASYGDRFTPSQIHLIGGSFVGLVIVGMLIVWFLYRSRARRRLRLAPSLPLAQRVWLSGTAHNWPQHFDAALWINQTGPTGPRVINSGPKAIEVIPDPSAHEETDVAAELARTFARSPMVWVFTLSFSALVLFQFALSMRIASRTELSLLVPALTLLNAVIVLHSLGWLPILRRVIIASPGRIEHTNFGRSLTFTRDDSVILVTPPSLNGWGKLIFLRNDRKYTLIPIRASNAPALNALLARWSYPVSHSTTPTHS